LPKATVAATVVTVPKSADTPSSKSEKPNIIYWPENQFFRFLLFPLGKISDYLVDIELKKVANYPEILLFCRVAATCLSIWHLLPKGEKPSNNQPADIASIASLTRNVIETFNTFFF
jgi:hypothetical protein